MSLLGWRQNKTARSAIWPLLVVVGLLTVPAECARIGHPHSLFQGASAAPSSRHSHENSVPHSAADHVHTESAYIPAWASPTADIAGLSGESASTSLSHPAHPSANTSASTPAPPTQAGGGGLPVVEPAAPAAFAALGTTLALLAALIVLLLPGRPRPTGLIAPLTGLLARALDPPPPRIQVVTC